MTAQQIQETYYSAVNRFKALQLLEGIKDKSFTSGTSSIKGSRLEDSMGRRTTAKISDTESQLERLIVKYVYDTTYEDRSAFGKVIDSFITYTRHLFLSFNNIWIYLSACDLTFNSFF